MRALSVVVVLFGDDGRTTTGGLGVGEQAVASLICYDDGDGSGALFPIMVDSSSHNVVVCSSYVFILTTAYIIDWHIPRAMFDNIDVVEGIHIHV